MEFLRTRCVTLLKFKTDSSKIRNNRNFNNTNESFITKYLEGRLETPLRPHCPIYSGKEPELMPNMDIILYDSTKITACVSGPDKGAGSIKRSRLHLSVGADIEFIDTDDELAMKISRSRRNLATSQQEIHIDKSDNQINNNVNETAAIMNNNDNETKIVIENNNDTEIDATNSIADLNWKRHTDNAYGVSISLYEKNYITGEHIGSPIADCFGLISRKNVCVMALSDGVNWGAGAKLAARSAIYGSLEYLNKAIFDSNHLVSNTRQVFVTLLRSFWEAQECILEVNGALTTLIVCVILPLASQEGKYAVCCCNVGDSLGFVYSKIHGVREFTIGSHDITSQRDMRDALGALGPCNEGNKPELGNLTLSLTIVEKGDIVFLTSDGVSDNFDPVVGKFAEAFTAESQVVQKENKMDLAPKRQNKSASNLHSVRNPSKATNGSTNKKLSSLSFSNADIPVRPPRTKKLQNEASSSSTTNKADTKPERPKYLRSKTQIEPRSIKSPTKVQPVFILKSKNGLPLVTGQQRHALTLLRMADLFSYGINGTLRPCKTAKQLCHLLIDFARMITLARRKMLEQRELFYKLTYDPEGMKKEVELTRIQQRAARKRIVDSDNFNILPGKLDHASVVAFTIGVHDEVAKPVLELGNTNLSIKTDYTETNF